MLTPTQLRLLAVCSVECIITLLLILILLLWPLPS